MVIHVISKTALLERMWFYKYYLNESGFLNDYSHGMVIHTE